MSSTGEKSLVDTAINYLYAISVVAPINIRVEEISNENGKEYVVLSFKFEDQLSNGRLFAEREERIFKRFDIRVMKSSVSVIKMSSFFVGQ